MLFSVVMSFSTELRKQNASRRDLVQNHVKSFNFLFANGNSPGCLDKIIEHLPTYEVDSPYIPDRPVWRYRIKNISLQKPTKTDHSPLDKRLFPAEVDPFSLYILFLILFDRKMTFNQFRSVTQQSDFEIL